ncbi:C-terminal binding protein [candidate division KSB1 bacterium]|nr:C-terminal binding protein [candidate division KSB1 bacterium]
MYQVYVTDFLSEIRIEKEILASVAQTENLQCTSEDQLPAKMFKTADALIVWHDIKISAASILRLKKCQAIIRCGVGFDNVDIRAAGQHGIHVCNIPDYGTEEVADHAIALMMTLVRRTAYLSNLLQNQTDAWNYKLGIPVMRFRNKTLGIIGLGRIGTAMALRAKALGMNILAYDPYIPDGKDKSVGVKRVDELPELLTASDVVSLNCPLTQETRHIISTDEFALMKPGAFLVNTARGHVVDTVALKAALENEKIGGAGLDVLENEPPYGVDKLFNAWRDAPKGNLKHLILTPHSAFYSEESFEEMRQKAALAAKRILEGKSPRNVVNGEFMV